MKRFVLRWVFFDLALMIIGVTWIAPVEAHQDRVEGASAASVSPASVAPASARTSGPVAVALNQWSITPQASQVPAGPVTFTVSNDGAITHEFVVMQTETPAADLHVGSFEGESPRVNEDTAGTNVGETGNLAAGTTKTITIDLKPGHYVFMCNLPAHYGLGMHTDFTVT